MRKSNGWGSRSPKFVTNYYRTNEMDISFLDGGGNVMSLSDLNSNSKIIVGPYGLTYFYPSFKKEELCVYMPKENLTALQDVTVTLKITTGDFSGSLSWDTKWERGGDASTGCVPLNLTLIDKDGHVQYAPSEGYDVNHWTDDTGSFVNGVRDIDILRGQPGGGAKRCKNDPRSDVRGIGGDCNIATSISFLMDSTDYYANFPGQFVVRDLNYNVSKTGYIT